MISAAKHATILTSFCEVHNYVKERITVTQTTKNQNNFFLSKWLKTNIHTYEVGSNSLMSPGEVDDEENRSLLRTSHLHQSGLQNP